MDSQGTTCWTLIRGAADGNAEDRDAFALRYSPVVKAYLNARWRHASMRNDVPDAVQEVLLECFRRGGVLDRLDTSNPPRFRAFLYGVTRHVANAIETRRRRNKEQQVPVHGETGTSNDTPSHAFQKAWARSVMTEAAELQTARARAAGPEALKRLELLRLRFETGLPIREIAARWNVDAALVHRAYARARKEFEEALREVLARHCPHHDPHLISREWNTLKDLMS